MSVEIGPTERCEAELRDAVLSGRYEVGARLPPERTLAEDFEVGRASVRTALTQLAAKGLLQPRQGSGYTVLDWRDAKAGISLLGELDGARVLDRVETARDLLRIRRHLAMALIETLRAPDTVAIAEAIDAFDALLAGGATLGEIAAADQNVLRALVGAAGSPVFSLALHPLLHVVQTLSWLWPALYAEPHSNVAAYRALLGWLGSHDDVSAATRRQLAALLESRDEQTLARLRRAVERQP